MPEQLHQITFATPEAKDLTRMRITPKTLLDRQRQGVHPAPHVRHPTCNPNLRARWKRDHDGSSTCTRRINNPGSRVAATDRRRPFIRVIPTKPDDAGATATSGVARSDAIPQTSCSGMVNAANWCSSEPTANSPSRYCRRLRNNNDRPRSCRPAVSATRPGAPKLSSTMRTFSASVQRRRRPVSVTDRISTEGLNPWSVITSGLRQRQKTNQTALGEALHMLGGVDQSCEEGPALLERRHAGDLGPLPCLQPGTWERQGSRRLPSRVHAKMAHLTHFGEPSGRSANSAAAG